MSIRIDPEFKSLIPPLSADEFQQLEQNILAEGIRDPLVTWEQDDGNEILVDGHNRWDIAAKHSGLPFKTVRKQFESRNDVELWIIDNQLGKRNLQLFDRGVLELRKKEILTKKAKSISKQNLTQFTSDRQKSDARGRVDEQIGKAIGASRDTVRKIELIKDKATPETIQLVRSGDKSINQAWLEIKRAEQPRIETPAERQERIQGRHEEFQNKPMVTIEETKQDRQDKEYLATSLWKTLTEAIKPINSINVMADSKRIDMSLIGSIKMSLREDLDREIDCAIKTLEDIKQAIRR